MIHGGITRFAAAIGSRVIAHLTALGARSAMTGESGTAKCAINAHMGSLFPVAAAAECQIVITAPSDAAREPSRL